MKVIGSMKEISALENDLAEFIMFSCPWLADGEWDPMRFGFIFILNNQDSGKVTSICAVQHVSDLDEDYKAQMTIDLESFDLWESPAVFLRIISLAKKR